MSITIYAQCMPSLRVAAFRHKGGVQEWRRGRLEDIHSAKTPSPLKFSKYAGDTLAYGMAFKSREVGEIA